MGVLIEQGGFRENTRTTSSSKTALEVALVRNRNTSGHLERHGTTPRRGYPVTYGVASGYPGIGERRSQRSKFELRAPEGGREWKRAREPGCPVSHRRFRPKHIRLPILTTSGVVLAYLCAWLWAISPKESPKDHYRFHEPGAINAPDQEVGFGGARV